MESHDIALEPVSPSIQPPCIGDIVAVSGSCSSTAAVVTKVHGKHCTAVTLCTENPSATAGEIWPNFENIKITNAAFRLGARVCLKGLRSSKMQPLNNAFGTVQAHPSRGHPVFVVKPASPAPVLTYCVRLDQKIVGQRIVLLEPQFLISEQQKLEELSAKLSDLVVAKQKLVEDSNVEETAAKDVE